MTLCEQLEFACLMEATACKPGNVHPAAAFDDLTYADFTRAAQAIAEPLSQAGHVGVGRAALNAVQATRAVVATNVNLGIVLLLAPLAAVPLNVPLCSGICRVLTQTTVEDSVDVYAAIRLARPGGLGTVDSEDVNERPSLTLRDVMALAAERDLIAAQYATNLELVFLTAKALSDRCARWNARHSRTGGPVDVLGLPVWEAAIVETYVELIAQRPDSHIVRKCGQPLAEEASRRAAFVIQGDGFDSPQGRASLLEFDTWLRADGHRRNPGSSADLIAASLFVAVREQTIPFPCPADVRKYALNIQRRNILQ